MHGLQSMNAYLCSALITSFQDDVSWISLHTILSEQDQITVIRIVFLHSLSKIIIDERILHSIIQPTWTHPF